MSVCLYAFSSDGTAGGLYQISVERKEKNQGGSYEASIRFTRLGGLKRIRLQNTDSVSRWLSVQHARMGFHIICIVGYHYYCSVKPT